MTHANSRQGINALTEILRPPRRIPVSKSAEEVVVITAVGGVNGPWSPDVAPYMCEPMDCLSSRLYTAVVFVGPARCGKTQSLSDCFIAHAVTHDPGDMLLVFPTEVLAYDYSKRRLRRLHAASEKIKKYISPRGHDNAIGTVIYRHGMMLNLAWPTSSQLAQRDIRYMVLSDYDSMPDDVGGEGEVFGIAQKRTQQFGSSGMTVAESSPKRVRMTVKWKAKTLHEAPPTRGGVLSLYNRGDRRRWYWQCLECREWFECPALPSYDDLGDPDLSAATAHVPCPHCGGIHLPRDKRRLNLGGRWVRDGQKLTAEGELTGEANRSKTASFWQLGCAAAFQSWQEMLSKYLHAMQVYEATGEEHALVTSHNVDQGLPYQPKSHLIERTADEFIERATDWGRARVPDGVRFLVATVDVQSNRFEVQVMGYGVDLQSWLVDRFALHWSERITAAGEREPLDPAGYAEDWRVLNQLLGKRYPLDDDSGRSMRVYFVACDYGGKAGVATRALNWWRGLKRKGNGERVRLVKGEGHKPGGKIPRVRETYPDTAKRKDRSSGSRGDVPMLILNTNELKDALSNDLGRTEPGPSYVNMPRWLDEKYYEEMVAEIRGLDGWSCPSGTRNETWDLAIYSRAVCIHIGAEKIDWKKPPMWARAWDSNANVDDGGAKKKPVAKKLAPAPGGHGSAEWSGRF